MAPVILLFSVFLWIIKKRMWEQRSEAGERPDDREQVRKMNSSTPVHVDVWAARCCGGCPHHSTDCAKPEVRKLQRIQLLCSAQSTNPSEDTDSLVDMLTSSFCLRAAAPTEPQELEERRDVIPHHFLSVDTDSYELSQRYRCQKLRPVSLCWVTALSTTTKLQLPFPGLWSTLYNTERKEVFSTAHSAEDRGQGNVLLLLIQGQNDWRLTCAPTQICAVVGSTVDISCSYRDPDWRTDDDTTAVERLWFTKSSGTEPVDLRADSEHSGRVQYLCGDNDCTLTITDLRESDSAVYKLSLTTNKAGEKHTGEAGVTLSVTGLQVQVTSSTNRRYGAELKCLSSCRPPDHSSFTWYKNGQKTGRETPSFSAYFYPSDSFSCALKGHEDFPSPPVSLELQVTRTITVHQSHTEAELKCLSSCSPADGLSYVWIRNGEKIMKEGSSYTDRFSPGDVVSCAVKGHESHGSPQWYHCAAENQLERRTSEHISIDVECEPVMIMNTMRLTLMLLMLITLVVFSLWTRKKKTLSSNPEPKEAVEMMEVDSDAVYEDVTTAAQTEDREEQRRTQRRSPLPRATRLTPPQPRPSLPGHREGAAWPVCVVLWDPRTVCMAECLSLSVSPIAGLPRAAGSAPPLAS
ncbi:hypothetical protein INR49_018336, partial [Caranx melampygus]